MPSRLPNLLTLTALLVLTITGCGRPAGSAHEAIPPTRAIAVLGPIGGSRVSGTVTFTHVSAGIRVEAHVNGLAPGDHGFHIH